MFTVTGRPAATSTLTAASISPTNSFLQRLKLKIHAPAERFHIAAGHLRTVIAPDDAAQHMHGGVCPHQLIAPIPVQRSRDSSADVWQVAGDEMGRFAGNSADFGDLPVVVPSLSVPKSHGWPPPPG